MLDHMKPAIPDTGTIIRLEGENAVIRMKHEGSCRKCGAAAIGLCKGGLMQELAARNVKQARVGDVVKIGLVQGVQLRGYLLAYVIPAAALVFGSAAGQFLGAYAGFPHLDIIAGMASLFAASFFSLRQLRRLDSASSIEIVDVLSDTREPAPSGADERTISEHYLSYF